MPHVVTQPCCADASCVFACPVNCIHPTPDEPDFLTAEMVYIDPNACVDCGSCVSACPVDAIVPERKLDESQQRFIEINADFFRPARTYPPLAKVYKVDQPSAQRGKLRVAIIGSGPSAMYAADDFARRGNIEVNILEKKQDFYGLARRGVAPDHEHTRRITELFDVISAEEGVQTYRNIEVGQDISVNELLEYHHAVLFATGASTDRKLGIPGEDLKNVTSATDFVAWYNGDPAYADYSVDLSGERIVVIGNGNVSIDVARILATDPELLADTTIAPYALNALRQSNIREVILVARRGPAEAAFTLPEFVGLIERTDIALAFDPQDNSEKLVAEALANAELLDHETRKKLELMAGLAERPRTGKRSIIFRFLLSPKEIRGTEKVQEIEFARNELVLVDNVASVNSTDVTEIIATDTVLTAVGYHGKPLADLPFSPRKGVVPNVGGRVVIGEDFSESLLGVYVAGWIKRGPSGYIGTNKTCAGETVNNIVDDFNTGKLVAPQRTSDALRARLS